MNIKKKLEDMATWSLSQYDISGSHIKDHFLTEDLTSTIKKSYEKKSVQEDKEERTFSFFSNAAYTEKLIHEVLKNHIIQERINFWISDDRYQKQTRMIITYPAKTCIGYAYTVKKEGFQIKKAEECNYISLVFCRQSNNPNKPLLYTAYPQATGPALILL